MFQFQPPSLINRGIHTIDLANKSIIMQAIAAVDIALWDAIGKVSNKPLYKILGAYRDRFRSSPFADITKLEKGKRRFGTNCSVTRRHRSPASK